MLAWCAGSLAACAAVGGVILAAGSGRVAGAAVLVAAPFLVAIAGLPVRRARFRQLLADPRHHPLDNQAAGRALTAALQASGIREVAVRSGPVDGLARSYRSGTRAVLLMHEALADRPDLSGFFAAHESAHIARHDFARRPVIFSSAAAIWAAAVVIWPWMLVTLPLLVVLAALFNRSMETDCDDLATRWAGLGQAEAAISVLAAALAREHLPAARRLRSALSYPPPERRLAAVRAVAARNPAP